MMISVLIGLVAVAVLGGAVAKYVHNNPTSSRRYRSSTRRGKAGARLVQGTVRAVKWARTRSDRARQKMRDAHVKAKKEGRTAATRTMRVIKDRRGVRGAWSDVKEAVTRRPPAEPDPPPEPKPSTAETPKPSTTETEGGTVPDPKPTSSTSPRPAGPSLVNLFEITDQMNALPFESLMQIKQFVTYLGMGCESIAKMYIALGQRMGGPMSIDRIVTEPVERCGAHQRAVHGSVSSAEQFLTMLLNSTPQDLLARGIRVPKAILLNGEPSLLGRSLVPAFYETASTLAARPVTDLRDVHALLKGLTDASDGQFRLYRRIAARLGELRIAGVADHFWTAARQQGAITAGMADADTAMGRLLNMTLRELATSNVRAPEVHLEGV